MMGELMNAEKTVELTIKNALNRLNAGKAGDFENCRLCYFNKTYGSDETEPLTVRKLITHLTQEDMDDIILIEVEGKIKPLTGCYLTKEGNTVIISAD